jgi:hypothetical protein
VVLLLKCACWVVGVGVGWVGVGGSCSFAPGIRHRTDQRPFHGCAGACGFCGCSVEVGPRRGATMGAGAGAAPGRSLRIVCGPLAVNTAGEHPFTLNPGACGPNLFLHPGHLVVTNLIHKKWNSVRCTVGFTSGTFVRPLRALAHPTRPPTHPLHAQRIPAATLRPFRTFGTSCPCAPGSGPMPSLFPRSPPGVNCWEVVIEKCVSKNIFVGVCNANANLTNYIGSDKNGWAYLANRAVWHNKVSVGSRDVRGRG